MSRKYTPEEREFARLLSLLNPKEKANLYAVAKAGRLTCVGEKADYWTLKDGGCCPATAAAYGLKAPKTDQPGGSSIFVAKLSLPPEERVYWMLDGCHDGGSWRGGRVREYSLADLLAVLSPEQATSVALRVCRPRKVTK